MNTKVERNSNIELFRIISMIVIVAHHYVVNSGLYDANGVIFSDLSNWRSTFLLIFGEWGKVGINCFVLITGYFMCKSNITIRKYVKLLAQIYFYKIVIYVILFFAGYETVSITNIIKLLLPVYRIDTDFTNCFLVFFLCIPFLNILVHNMTKKMHICLLILLGISYIILPTLHMSVSYNYVIWFSVLYIISSYVRLYPIDIFRNTKFWGIVSIISFLLASVSIYIIPSSPYYYVADSNKILAVLVAFSAFMFFKNVKIGYSKVINVIASTTFGVLCIHAASDGMRQWLWKDFIDCVGYYSDKYLPVYAIVCVLGIFMVCSLIDLLRIKFLERPFMEKWDNKLYPKINKWWNNLLKR